jgi:hypothetical protein
VAEVNEKSPTARSDPNSAIDKPELRRVSSQTDTAYEQTLEALHASPHCRRIITSGPTQVWTLSSHAQVAAFKRALGPRRETRSRRR